MAYSCSDESNIEQEKQAVKPVDTEQRPPQPTTTIQSTTTEPVQHESVFPPGKYKTLKDLMNNCFSTGSTRSEVRRVQGEPDYTEANLPLENWYYGRCVVQFKGQLVGGVSNPDGSLKYADYFELALSPDKTESEFYLLINSRINR
jgi:hypothetical protein